MSLPMHCPSLLATLAQLPILGYLPHELAGLPPTSPNLQQLLEPERRPVAQVEEAVPGVVAVEGLLNSAARVWAFLQNPGEEKGVGDWGRLWPPSWAHPREGRGSGARREAG